MIISNMHELSMISEGGYQYSLSMVLPSHEVEMKAIFNDIDKGFLNFNSLDVLAAAHQSDYIMYTMKGAISEYCSSIHNAVLLANVNFHLTKLTTAIELPLFAMKCPDLVFILGFVTISSSSQSSITYTTHLCPNPDGKYIAFDYSGHGGMISPVPSFREFSDLPGIGVYSSNDSASIPAMESGISSVFHEEIADLDTIARIQDGICLKEYIEVSPDDADPEHMISRNTKAKYYMANFYTLESSDIKMAVGDLLSNPNLQMIRVYREIGTISRDQLESQLKSGDISNEVGGE